MNRILPIVMVVIAALLIAAGTLHSGASSDNSHSPDGVVQQFYEDVKVHDYDAANSLVSRSSNIDAATLARDIGGRDGSLKTYSELQKAETRVVARNGNEAIVRASLQWITAVGVLNDSKDVKTVNEDGVWRVLWPKHTEPNLPPQVIPVNYLRWDVVHSDSEDNEWGAQNVEAPHVRIISMNAIEKDGKVIILGEIENADTVPGFVSVNGTLLGKNGEVLGEESSFDKISHVLLPKEISPFRIDFDNLRLADVKSVHLDPSSLLVPASADPVIGVLDQKLQKTDAGHTVLTGELMNESGELVNIPHIIATYYDNAGKVIWVSDSYVDQALRPEIPVPFSAELRDDLVGKVHSYRVTVNQFSVDRTAM